VYASVKAHAGASQYSSCCSQCCTNAPPYAGPPPRTRSHISHSDYHKHGAYILDHADAAGFALFELHRLGLLVLGHRGKLRKLDADFGDELFVHQLLALRLAVILCHARRDPDLGGVSLRALPQGLVATVRPDWAAAFPQSAHLLREETIAWQKTPWTFSLA